MRLKSIRQDIRTDKHRSDKCSGFVCVAIESWLISPPAAKPLINFCCALFINVTQLCFIKLTQIYLVSSFFFRHSLLRLCLALVFIWRTFYGLLTSISSHVSVLICCSIEWKNMVVWLCLEWNTSVLYAAEYTTHLIIKEVFQMRFLQWCHEIIILSSQTIFQ